MHRRRRLTPAISESLLRLRSVGPAAVLCTTAAFGSLALGTTSRRRPGVSAQAPATAGNKRVVDRSTGSCSELSGPATESLRGSDTALPGAPLNPCDPYSCLWPFTNAMAGTAYSPRGRSDQGYATDVLARTLGLLSYADLHETSPTGTSQTPAFQSAVAPPRGPGGNTYYDDNAWAALDLIAAYRLTGSNIDLFVAQDLLNFVLTGWDTSRTDGCPGGVFWEDVSGSQRNTPPITTNAEVGLELYQLTKNVTDLFGAAVMYQWVNTCLKSPDDLYYDHVNPGGTVNTTIWSYNQGTMVGVGSAALPDHGKHRLVDQCPGHRRSCNGLFRDWGNLAEPGAGVQRHLLSRLVCAEPGSGEQCLGSEAQAYATFMWTQRNVSGLFLPEWKHQRCERNGADGRDLLAPRREPCPAIAGLVKI